MQATPDRDKLIDIATLVAMLRRSRASIYRNIRSATVPKSLKLGNSSRWLLCEIENDIAQLAGSRS